MKKSALAITGLILGIVALATSFIPIINNISFFIALLGVVFAVIGLVSIVKGKSDGKTIAIVGIILNIVAVVIVFASQSFYGAAIDGALSEPSASSISSAEGSSAGSVDQSSEPRQAAQEEKATESKYAVTIDDCVVTTDYAGKPAAVVTYTFTNNSEDATSFMVAIHDQCFQNGVQLELAIVNDLDSSRSMSEIKPGASITIQQAYVLDDQSDLTVECTELISLDDTVLAEATFSVA
ncbi:MULTISPECIES: DUF5067 domain-containing protein [unclassified Adlercreutzia]|uniref:DUF5067 domain-containing protein n=1 Tax=unclassified Adlercreutzia TaxID=2636013 RepID=UPI0013ED8AAB|nr:MULTISPECIES: DUF5067 domain-containing protein [unclassified Adlercreutzia]